MTIVTSSFLEKLRFQNVFAKPMFSNSSGLKSVFEKLRLRGGSECTVDLTVEIKLRFPPAYRVHGA